MEELQEFSENEKNDFDLKAEIYKYLVHWKWLVLGSLLGLLIAYLYNRYTTPEFYTGASMMVLKDDQRNIAGALPSGGASILAIDDSSLENQIETLRSKRLVENVIDELDFNISYFIEGNVIAVESYQNRPITIEFLSPDSLVHNTEQNLFITPESSTTFRLMAESLNYSETHKFGEIITLDGLDFSILPREEHFRNNNTVNVKVEPLRHVAGDFISRMTIAPKGKAQDILALSITGEVPQKSQDFLNALMRHFNLDGMADKRQVAEYTADFIQNRLQIISEELDSVEGGMADFKRENRIMDVGAGAGKYMAKSSEAEQKIFELETQLMIIREVRDALTSSEPYRLLPNLGIQDGGGVSAAISSYNELVLERDRLLRTSTSNNPAVEVITDRLDLVKANLLDNIEGVINAINIELRELNALDQRAENLFSTFPGLERGMRNIERQQMIKEELYLFLLQRREESAISFASTSPVAKVIDPAFTVAEPVGPKPWIILVGGFIVGLLIPLITIFVRNFLDTKVHHKGDLNNITRDIPLLGEIPAVSKDENQIIELNDRSPLAESFRILRTNLAYLVQSRNKDKGQVIFVTSTIKGEGKTFISYNLARTLASTNKKVLLIGADIRNPKLHKFTGAAVGTDGLSDFLYNRDIDSSKIITKSDHGGIPVDLILSGAIPPNPAELFMNERMKELLKTEEKNYDYVIVDTAPTMIVTDTLLISPLADTTLYVARAGYTEKKLLEFPKDLKQQGKLKGLAIVLNDVDYSKFSYGAKYGYAYGYGYGYGADDEKKPFFKRIFSRKQA